MNFLENPYAITWLEKGIIHQELKPEVRKITLEIAKNLVSDRKQILKSNNTKGLVFVRVKNAVQVDKDARDFYKLEDPYEDLEAIAMLMDNYLAQMIGNLVFLFKGHSVPTKFFNKKEKALVWLRSF